MAGVRISRGADKPNITRGASGSVATVRPSTGLLNGQLLTAHDEAVAAAAAAALAETNAETAETGAVAAEAGAVAAKVAAEAVGSTNDTIIAGRVNDPASATRAALNDTYGGAWQPSTAYAVGDLFAAPDGTIRQVTTAHTSGTTYSTANSTASLDPFVLATRKTATGVNGWSTTQAVIARSLGWIVVTDEKYAGGADPTGVASSVSAVAAAQAALPAYSGGFGSSVLYFPAGVYKHDGTLTLGVGQSIRGAGKHASLIRGAVAGPIIDTTTDGTGNPLTDYVDVQGIFVNNTSTNIAAKAARFRQMSHLTLRDAHFSSSASGAESCTVQVSAVYDIDAYRTNFAGVGPDRGLDCPGTYSCTIVRINHCTFSDTKAAARFINGSVLEYVGNHHENIAGSPATYGGIVTVDNWSAGNAKGNYFESCYGSPFVFYQAAGAVRGFEIGFNFFTNTGSPAIDASTLKNSIIFPNYIKPGAISPNQNGVILSSNSDNITLHKQYLASGTGAAHTVTGATSLTTVGLVVGHYSFTVSATGAYNIDRSLVRDPAGTVLITLAGTATSSTIINAANSAGQRLTIVLIQDATGGRAFTWPTNCKFAGGTAPSDTTANSRTTVVFDYHLGNWYEVSRAVGVV